MSTFDCMKWTIYCLSDEVTHEVYYVGCSMSVSVRLKGHWAVGGKRHRRKEQPPESWRDCRSHTERREALMRRVRAGLESVIPCSLGEFYSEEEATAFETLAIRHFNPPCNKMLRSGGYKKSSGLGKMPASWRTDELPLHPMAHELVSKTDALPMIRVGDVFP